MQRSRREFQHRGKQSWQRHRTWSKPGTGRSLGRSSASGRSVRQQAERAALHCLGDSGSKLLGWLWAGGSAMRGKSPAQHLALRSQEERLDHSFDCLGKLKNTELKVGKEDEGLVTRIPKTGQNKVKGTRLEEPAIR